MEKKAKRKKHIGIIVLAALLLIIAALFVDSNSRLVVTEYELSYDNLPQGFQGYKIVELADLHLAQYGEENSRLLELVKNERPDIITLNGDFLDKYSSLQPGDQAGILTAFLKSLSAIAPCYFVSGNHEWASGGLPELALLLDELGIKYLHNEFVLLRKGDEQIVLAGVEDPNGPADMMKPDELVDIISVAYPDTFRILLGHRPYWMERYPDLQVNIILCGHAHGGVVRLPFLGGVFGTERDLFPEYDAGVYNEGGFDMVLSRGLGGSAPMPRFLNNPEIVSVTLRKS